MKDALASAYCRNGVDEWRAFCPYCARMHLRWVYIESTLSYLYIYICSMYCVRIMWVSCAGFVMNILKLRVMLCAPVVMVRRN